MKKNSLNITGAAVVVCAGVATTGAALSVVENVTESIAQGLHDSESIRVSQNNVCTEQEDGEAHFSGCNSIL